MARLSLRLLPEPVREPQGLGGSLRLQSQLLHRGIHDVLHRGPQRAHPVDADPGSQLASVVAVGEHVHDRANADREHRVDDGVVRLAEHIGHRVHLRGASLYHADRSEVGGKEARGGAAGHVVDVHPRADAGRVVVLVEADGHPEHNRCGGGEVAPEVTEADHSVGDLPDDAADGHAPQSLRVQHAGGGDGLAQHERDEHGGLGVVLVQGLGVAPDAEQEGHGHGHEPAQGEVQVLDLGEHARVEHRRGVGGGGQRPLALLVRQEIVGEVRRHPAVGADVRQKALLVEQVLDDAGHHGVLDLPEARGKRDDGAPHIPDAATQGLLVAVANGALASDIGHLVHQGNAVREDLLHVGPQLRHDGVVHLAEGRLVASVPDAEQPVGPFLQAPAKPVHGVADAADAGQPAELVPGVRDVDVEAVHDSARLRQVRDEALRLVLALGGTAEVHAEVDPGMPHRGVEVPDVLAGLVQREVGEGQHVVDHRETDGHGRLDELDLHVV
mmetsp:Transcript_30872/g.89867  ORF Transcript_30872/g.89867 Transcript_30872/m.89867 type:complete len:499 (-) Transcript_30872:687-2183(-)